MKEWRQLQDFEIHELYVNNIRLAAIVKGEDSYLMSSENISWRSIGTSYLTEAKASVEHILKFDFISRRNHYQQLIDSLEEDK